MLLLRLFNLFRVFFVIEKREGGDGLQRGADHGGPPHPGPPPHQQGHGPTTGTPDPSRYTGRRSVMWHNNVIPIHLESHDYSVFLYK